MKELLFLPLLFIIITVRAQQAQEPEPDVQVQIAYFTEQLEKDPEVREFYERRGKLWFEQEDFDKALNDYNKALDLGGENAENLIMKGWVLHMMERDSLALQAFQAALRLDPANADIHDHLGLSYGALGENEKAAAHFKLYLEEYPEDARGHYNLAKAYIEMKAYEEAQEELDLLEGVGFYKAYVGYQQALLWRVQGKYESAIGLLKKLTAEYDEFELWEELFLNQFLAGRYEEALVSISHMLEMDPENALSWYRRGIMKRLVEDWNGARTDLEHILQLGFDPEHILFELGKIYTVLEDYELAIAAYDRLIGMDPENPEYYFGRGLAVQYSDREEYGCADFQKALKMGLKEAREYLDEYCEAEDEIPIR